MNRPPRWVDSFRFAARGLFHDLPTQRNARLMIGLGGAAAVLGFVCEIGRIEWLLVVFAIGFVLACETINSAIERVVDLASPEWTETARAAKDLAAGASLIASMTAAAVGLFIFGPRLLEMISK